MAACKMSDSPRHCDKILRWHLDLIKTMGKNATSPADAATAWNRHSPLAAQAIALGRYGTAIEVLKRAKAIAAQKKSDPVSVYARRQYENKGAEWMVHRVVEASYYVAQSRGGYSSKLANEHLTRATEALADPLNSKYIEPSSALIFLRPAKLYELSTKTAANTRHNIRVNAFAVPANGYWTYFPGLPDGESLRY
jgi:hypothetical protein